MILLWILICEALFHFSVYTCSFPAILSQMSAMKKTHDHVCCCRYRTEMDSIMARWRRLGTTLSENAQRIQELMAKLLQFEVRLK